MAKPNVDLNLNREQLAAIGLLSARWSFFETEMDFTISALGSLMENDQRLPQRLNERIKRWRSLAKRLYTDTKVYEHIDDLITRAKNLHDTRCVVLHGRCYGDPTGQREEISVETHRHLATWDVHKISVTAKQILGAASKFEATAIELIKFNEKHLPVLPKSFPRKYP